MTAGAEVRAGKPPRGLLLITGEDLPGGASLRARHWTVEVAAGSVNFARLSECQRCRRTSDLAADLELDRRTLCLYAGAFRLPSRNLAGTRVKEWQRHGHTEHTTTLASRHVVGALQSTKQRRRGKACASSSHGLQFGAVGKPLECTQLGSGGRGALRVGSGGRQLNGSITDTLSGFTQPMLLQR